MHSLWLACGFMGVDMGAAGAAFAAPIISADELKFADAIGFRTNKCYLSKQKVNNKCKWKKTNKHNKTRKIIVLFIHHTQL